MVSAVSGSGMTITANEMPMKAEIVESAIWHSLNEQSFRPAGLMSMIAWHLTSATRRVQQGHPTPTTRESDRPRNGTGQETRFFSPSSAVRLRSRNNVFRVSPQIIVIERFTRVSDRELNYVFTVTDQTYYTRPLDRRNTSAALDEEAVRVRLPRGQLFHAGHARSRTSQ